jgi:methylated-DNA-[protein]-cysteine S-methyltransferase
MQAVETAVALGSVTTWAGTTRVLATDRGVREAHLPRVPMGITAYERRPGAELRVEHATSGAAEAHLRIALQELAEFFAGERREFSVALDPRGGDFYQRAWRGVAAIPYGETRTYLEVAREIGTPQAPRAVGSANAANPVAPFVPCHRVPASDGSLHGYGPGLPLKRAILLMEDAMPADSADYAAWVERVSLRMAGHGHPDWYLGVRGTGTFCAPGCERGGERLLQPNRLLYSLEQAQRADFRPCPACRPGAAVATPALGRPRSA